MGVIFKDGNELGWIERTSCGSQLVGMLEEFNTMNLSKDPYNLEYQIVHNDMTQTSAAYTLVKYQKEYVDLLHEKNKRTYHGLHNSLDWESDIVFQLDMELFKYKLAKEQEGFKIYG